MNCRDAKVAIALHLGHDEADPGDWELARRHVSACAECRVHYRSLKKSMTALEQADVEQTYEVQKSLWPDLKHRLPKLPGQKPEPKPRSWAPFISFTVACVLFLAVWINPPREHGHVDINASEKSLSPFARLLDQPRKERDIKQQAEIDEIEDRTRETL